MALVTLGIPSMGRVQAEGMAEMGLDLATLLHWHLQCNHFPPVHDAFIPAAKEAIIAVECEDEDALIQLPNGKVLEAWRVVEGLHLDTFIGRDE